MLDKQLQARTEAARNAISGYVAVVLALVCFVLLLVVAMALTRFFVGLSLAADTSSTVQQTSTISQTVSGT